MSISSKLKSTIIALFSISAFFFIAQLAYAGDFSDLNGNDIADEDESEVVMTANKSLNAGEYFFNDLTITNVSTLTLKSDSNSVNEFKGVKIHANNLTIDLGATISTNGQGYDDSGPGGVESADAGASHGGVGGGNIAASVYGSSLIPITLGSGWGAYLGGGAVWFEVSNFFINNGAVLANATGYRSSGGSIYVNAGTVSGAGRFRANGSGSTFPYTQAGGGGRIAIHYNDADFTGETLVNAGEYCLYGCNTAGENGTAIWVNKITNDAYISESFHFESGEVFNFDEIYINGTAHADIRHGVNMSVNKIYISNSAELRIDDEASLNSDISITNTAKLWSAMEAVISAQDISMSGGTWTLNGGESLTAEYLNLQNGAQVTSDKGVALYIEVDNINIDNTSSVDVSGKGYCNPDFGPGAPDQATRFGASHGGLGHGVVDDNTYGNENAPTEFGSAIPGFYFCGGGAVHIVTDSIQVDGSIKANGDKTSAGGSVYIQTSSISGIGSITALGGNSYCPGDCWGSGGGGRIAVYYDNAAWTGNLTADPGDFCLYGCAPGGTAGSIVFNQQNQCDPEAASNVMFLPGIEASRLYRQKNILGINTEDQLWEPNTPNDVEDLYLNSDGSSINTDIYTRDIIGRTNISAGVFDQNIYKSFSENMDSLASRGIMNEWIPFAYDWRQDIYGIVNTGTPYQGEIRKIKETVAALAENSKSCKTTIITHSTGGIVAKALLKELQEDKDAGVSDLIDKVDTLVLVAVPQIGTPDAVSALLHGIRLGPGGILMDNASSRTLSRYMSSAYSLLPSQAYINHVDVSPVVFTDTEPVSNITTLFVHAYGNILDSYNKYKDFLFGTEGRPEPDYSDIHLPIKLSSTIFQKAEDLHNDIDYWTPPPGMRVIEVAGWGIDTLASIEYYPKYVCSGHGSNRNCGYVMDELPRFTAQGDKTVVQPSALWMSENNLGAERYWLNLDAYNNSVGLNRNHKNIFEVPDLNDFIDQVLKKDPLLVGSYISNTEPVDTSDRIRLSVHSPVTIDAYDEFGNHTGKVCPVDSEFCFAEENIPNSSYYDFGEGKYINLPQDQFHIIKLQGTDTGTFTYKSEVVNPDGTSDTDSFINIPVTSQTQAEVTMNTETNELELRLDINGDGVLDATINPGQEFNPVEFLGIVKKQVESFGIAKGTKKELTEKINELIKFLSKEREEKTKSKIEKLIKEIQKNLLKKEKEDSKKELKDDDQEFKNEKENNSEKLGYKKSKDEDHPEKYLSEEEANYMLDMLRILLDNLR